MCFAVLPEAIHTAQNSSAGLPPRPPTTPGYAQHTLYKNAHWVLYTTATERPEWGKVLCWYEYHTHSKSQVLAETAECKKDNGWTWEQSRTLHPALLFISFNIVLHHSWVKALLSVIVTGNVLQNKPTKVKHLLFFWRIHPHQHDI